MKEKKRTNIIVKINRISAITLLENEYDRFCHITSRGPGARVITTAHILKSRGGFLKGDSNLLRKTLAKESSYFDSISLTVFCSEKVRKAVPILWQVIFCSL